MTGSRVDDTTLAACMSSLTGGSPGDGAARRHSADRTPHGAQNEAAGEGKGSDEMGVLLRAPSDTLGRWWSLTSLTLTMKLTLHIHSGVRHSQVSVVAPGEHQVGRLR